MVLSGATHVYQYFFCLLQEDSALTESRPGTAQTVVHVDPLAVDIEDLYVKYKVTFAHTIITE